MIVSLKQLSHTSSSLVLVILTIYSLYINVKDMEYIGVYVVSRLREAHQMEPCGCLTRYGHGRTVPGSDGCD
jgi:hypothetical protein